MDQSQPMLSERLDRHIKLFARLKKDERQSPTQLARSFGLSSKTIQRDLHYMRFDRKWPVAYDDSKKGWYLTGKGLALQLTFASTTDLQAVMILGELVTQYAGSPLGDMMKNAFERTLALFQDGEDDNKKVRRISQRIRFVAAPSPALDPAIWKGIIAGLQQDQTLEIEYRRGGSQPPTRRKFDPYGLIVRNRDSFLLGYCHQKKVELTLFVPYITEVRVLEDEDFELPLNFDLGAFVKSGFMGLQGGREARRKVVIRFSPEAAGAAVSAPFTPDQKTERDPSGHLLVTFETNALFLVQRELMRWAADAEVLEPEELRNDIKESVEEMLDLYSKRIAKNDR